MTHELSEQNHNIHSQNALMFEQIAANQVNAEIHTIGQYVPSVFDMPPVLAGAVNHREKVSQALHGIVKAGDELFGIVHVDTVDSRDPHHQAGGFILARFGSGDKRATVVGQLEPGISLDVGRHNLEAGVRDTTAINHFNIAINPEGKLVVEDNGSHTGTELMIAPKGVSEIDKQLQDFNKWAPKSAAVKESIAGRRDVNTARLRREYDRSQPLEVMKPAVDHRAELVKQQAKLQEQLENIAESFSHDDKMNLWRYASGTLNKKDAQKRGDGQVSTNEGQYAGQAYKALSGPAKEVANNYLTVMSSLELIIDRIAKLK